MEIKLLNFNHNCTKAGEYYIDRFKFIVEKNHIDNLKLLTLVISVYVRDCTN